MDCNPSPPNRYPACEYAIVRNGKAYTGSVYGTPQDWTLERWKAFPYTLLGACRKIAAFPAMFKGCKVERVEDWAASATG